MVLSCGVAKKISMKEITVRTGRVVGDLTMPDNPTTDKLVLILHGMAGHRDYCYQRLLGRQLPDTTGLWTFRFDFRNCGDSDPVPDPQNSGRTVYHTDFEDISEVVNYFQSKNLKLFTMIGHSRGFAASIYWTIKTGYKLPCLVNCSGRCEVENYAKLPIEQHGFRILHDGGHHITEKRYGKYVEQWIPLAEIISNSAHSSDEWRRLNEKTQILTIFGSDDHMISTDESLKWAAMFQGRHTLEILAGADHNFFGPPKKSGEKKHTYAPEVIDIIAGYLDRFLQPQSKL